jgi:hypothetical protein
MALPQVSLRFAVTARAEIVGCYLPWLVLRQGRRSAGAGGHGDHRAAAVHHLSRGASPAGRGPPAAVQPQARIPHRAQAANG